MDFYNRRGVFHNAKDTPRGLRAALERHFGDVRVELRGCVGVWTAKRPIRS